MDDQAFRQDFFRHLTFAALEPTDPRYVPIYGADARIVADDPVTLMRDTIQWTVGASVQLFSGFRGSGKSTELLRLRRDLQAAKYLVLLVDVEEYLNLSMPVDVPDFLLALAGAIGDTVVTQGLLPDDPAKLSYWDRFAGFLRGIRLEDVAAEVGAGPAKVSVKANLRSAPSFVRTLQRRMAEDLGAFVLDVQAYVTEIVQDLRDAHPAAEGVVLLVDSVEHIRGVLANAEDVQRSVENLFAVHASKLALPGMHLVYTVPPWLKIRYPNLDTLYDPGGLQVLPSLKVRSAGTREPFEPGLEILERVVTARGEWGRLITAAELRHLSLESGGHLRDLLRLLIDVTRRATTLPAGDAVVARAVAAARDQALPIPNADAEWLARIAETNSVELPDLSRLPDLARFLDTHLVLCYHDGQEWYDVHPLVRETVLAQAARVRAADSP